MTHNVREIVAECSRVWKVDLMGIDIRLEVITEKSCGKQTLGYCCPAQRRILLKPFACMSPEHIRKILVHELAHYVDWHRNCENFRTGPTGRIRFHDQVFKEILRELAVVHPTWVQNLTLRGIHEVK